MSIQTRYGMTFGSGQAGIDTEARFRLAALKSGLDFPVWIRQTLEEKADEVLGKSEEKVGGTE